MFLLEPAETPYDLRWQMFGIPVRVHPMFWLLSMFLGWGAAEAGLEYLLLWVGCVFISILIHELGHVFMGRVFGADGHIVLYSFGGLAIGSNRLSRRWQRILVCSAGPLAGFLLLVILFALLWARDPGLFQAQLALARLRLGFMVSVEEVQTLARELKALNPLERFVVDQLIFINLVWGLLNLLPIWPLDGGQISRDICEGAAPARGVKVSLGISLVVAGVLALLCLLEVYGRTLLPFHFGSKYSALMFGLLALQSWQLMHQAQSEHRWLDDHWQDERR